MGIQGLLPLLKSIMVPIHIKDLEGCSVAVDTYSWLHKGALSCSKELCKGQPTSKHISYCMHRVNLLRHHGIKPVLVFDGGHLPMKSEQENKRARSRKENFARALEHESGGNKAAAYECYSKAVDITPSIAYDLIQVLKQENVAYVVAPYEADAQMTFLAVNKLVDAVITEDSDLIPFGCPRIIYKMDKFGQGLEFCSSRLQQNKDLNFTGFTKQMFLEMCILSGCDYLQSLPGMGLKRAYALLKKFKSYDKVIKHLMYSNVAVPPLYEEFFWKALLTFQHQRVYDPITEDIVHLSDITDNTGENTDFLGPSISQNMAKGIATGDLDPFTKLPFQGKCVTSVSMPDDSNQPLIKNVEGERKKIDLPIQKNLLTNYFCFTSLEAKRKFVVPRVTSKHPETRSEVHTHRDNIETVFAHNADCSSPVLSFTGPEIVDSTKDSVFNDVVAAKSSVSSELAHGSNDRENDLQSLQCSFNQARHSIYPCMVVNKERQRQMESNTVNSKMRIEQKNVTVRSSYFQKKSVEANGQGNKDGEFFVKDIDLTARSMSTIYQCESKSALDRSEGETISEDRDPILLSPIKSVNTIDHTSTNGKTLMSAAAADTRASTIPLQEGKSAKNAAQQTRTESRKVVVRSPYFMQRIGKENDQDTKSCPTKDVATATYENTINGVCNKYYKGTDSKRKLDNIQTELLARKCLRTNGSLPIRSTGTLDPEDSVVTTNEQDKFGCNISHIDRYSNIAEKSIEKFASMISSFRYTSGSRASGLRAPLKDVQNNFTKSTSNRTEAADLSKFAYVPTNQRRFLASRR